MSALKSKDLSDVILIISPVSSTLNKFSGSNLPIHFYHANSCQTVFLTMFMETNTINFKLITHFKVVEPSILHCEYYFNNAQLFSEKFGFSIFNKFLFMGMSLFELIRINHSCIPFSVC